MVIRHAWAVVALLAAACAASEARAADDPSARVEELLVTAQRRVENIQHVPLSLMAVDEAALEARNVDDVRGLERVVAGLRLETITQSAGISIRIRGFGAQSNAAIDPSVAPYLDGVFIPRPGAILSTFLDVERVEVLRGPQGTLLGRNATVGALSVATRAPDPAAFAARMAAQAGRFGERQIDGFVNLPLSQQAALRIAVLANETDGYVENLLDGSTYGQRDLVEGRISLRWRPTDRLSWTGRADIARTTGDGVSLYQADTSTVSPAQLAAYRARLGGNTPILQFPPSRTTNQVFADPNLTDHQYGVTSHLTYDAPGGFTLRLINAYRDWRNTQRDGDSLHGPTDVLNRDAVFDSESYSHELQLISPQDRLLGGRLDFVAGLYAFSEDYVIEEALNLGATYCSFPVAVAAPGLVSACLTGPKGGAARSRFTQSAESTAVYAQATIAIAPRLDLTLGARQTWDRKAGDFVQVVSNPAAGLLRAPESASLSFKDDRPSWRAGLSWRVTPEIMTFATFSTGYKSGGLNSAGGAAALGARRIFDSETSEDWEVGVKSTLFERRLRLNLTAYRTDLNEFQERSYDGVSFIVRNAGSVRAQGVEFEVQGRPWTAVTLDASVAYLDSKFTQNRFAPGLPGCTGAASSCPLIQDLTGRRSTFAPEWTVNLGGQYVTQPFAGGFVLTLRLDSAFTSRYYSVNDLNPQGIVEGFTLYSGRIALTAPNGRWNLVVFGENLTDERYFRIKFPQTLDGLLGVRVPATGATLLRGFVGQPRTWGVRATRLF